MKEVYIVSIARTPIGNLGGVLSGLSAVDLGKAAISAAVQRSGVDPALLQEVYMGNVLTANVGQAPATQASRAAGLPDGVACTTVNKVCASGMKAVMFGAQSILLGDADLVVAGGMESMTNAPHYLPSGRSGIKYGDGVVLDAIKRDGLQDPYDGSMMGNCGEVCSTELNISRQAQDEYAWASYERARHAYAQGYFADEIAPLSVSQGKNTIAVDTDEEVNNSRIAGLASLQGLRPAFDKNGTITAGNASKINDGAAALVLASGEQVRALGLKPIARVVSYADANQQPVWFTTTPALAMPKAAAKAGLSMGDIDYFEINEAFAVVALANMQQLGLSHDRVNVFGGAVALGHPIGASGARIICTLISVLRQRGGKRGMAGICNGGGGASAIIIELV